MKRHFKYISLLIFILLLSLSTACSNQSNPEPEDSDVSVSEPSKRSGILDSKTAFGDSNNLFYISNEAVESGLMQSIVSYNGNFLLHTADNSDYHLKLISANTGEILASNSFTDIVLPNIQVCGDKLAITDWFDGKILLLDDNLQITNQYKVNCDFNSMYVTPDATKVYVFHPSEGIQITTFETNKVDVLLEETTNLYTSDEFKTHVTFSYIDLKSKYEMYGALNLATGEIIDLPFKGSFFNLCYAKDYWYATLVGTLDSHYVGNNDSLKTLKLGNASGHITISPETGYLLLTQYGESGFLKMAAYKTDGTFVSECRNSLEGTVVQEKPFWSETDGGYYFIMVDSSGNDMLMFWDVNAECSGENLPLQELEPEVLSENAVSKELYERAKELSSTYGIKIRIAEQLWNEYVDYNVETCLDEYTITNALDSVENVFSVYPEGFFKQLTYGSIHEVELHLSGHLTNRNMPDGDFNGFSSFSGFAFTEGSKSAVVLDITSATEQLLHHELFHLIDDKLIFDAQIRPDSKYSEEEWMKLNPPGFEYAGDLFNLPDSIYDDEYGLWFADIYSRTYAREDRAVIMEHAGIGMHDMFISAPYRQAKLEYLIECIRDAFDTSGWPETTVWEDTLDRSLAY